MLSRPLIKSADTRIVRKAYGRLIPPASVLHAFSVSPCRAASSASSTRWKTRQAQDHFTREARVQGLKSRAAFKLLQINDKYKLFKRGFTVVDLGYAPGSWSQVAINRTAPGGRVIGVDILPAQPPRGVSTIQGDFLSPEIQAEVRAYVLDPARGRPIQKLVFGVADGIDEDGNGTPDTNGTIEEHGYIDIERKMTDLEIGDNKAGQEAKSLKPEIDNLTRVQREELSGRVVDVVLSDMSEPWEQTTGFGKRSISDPYFRLMNTSGMPFRDHAGSMDLCTAALLFCFDTLKSGGHFVCKFYQGSEDKLLEKKLKRLFEKVHRDKPSASRSESKEGFFVGLRRKEAPTRDEVFAD